MSFRPFSTPRPTRDRKAPYPFLSPYPKPTRSYRAPNFSTTTTTTDTNCDIYPVKEGERLTFVLASTLDLSGKPDDGTYKPLGDEVTD